MGSVSVSERLEVGRTDSSSHNLRSMDCFQLNELDVRFQFGEVSVNLVSISHIVFQQCLNALADGTQ